MRVLTLRLVTLVALVSLFLGSLTAQAGLQQAATFIQDNAQKFGNSPNVQWEVVDNFTDKAGVTHVRLIQTYKGIELSTQIVSVHIQNGEVIHSTGNFNPKVENLNRNKEQLDATAALQIALQNRSLTTTSPIVPASVSREANKETLYQLNDIALQPVKSRLLYINYSTNDVRLVWDVDIYEKDGNHWWSVRIDAENGEVLSTRDQVLHCDFGAPDAHEHIRRLNKLEEMTCEEQDAALNAGMLSYKAYGEATPHNHTHDHAHDHGAHSHSSAGVAANSYRALPLGVESPNHGAFQLITNPQLDNIDASPNGWHNDGTNSYTITRGNNVHAQEDQNANNGTGFSPDGGANLCFDWTFNSANDPATGDNLNAAITNLFVWNNFMHDIYYNYGFTEECFNFQNTNFGRGGNGGDYVLADAQDGSSTNNATFGTPGDGGNPVMSMYMWTAAATSAFTVNSGGGGIAGGYGAVGASFGPANFSITGDVIIADDGTGAPTEACNALTNGGAIAGNIALIDRGNCEFGAKVLNAENAGAIAVIVCNNAGTAPIAMGPGAQGGSVTIPSVMISQGDCATIRAQIPTVNVTMSASGGNFQLDGDYDSGIIAHEYGHGISNRMTSSTAGCLGNADQMGEGWSDFWGLVLTVQPSHDANTARGIGTYATGEPTTGGGIRPFPYTRDMSVNPITYNDSNNAAQFSQPHGIGSIWCTMIWDLYWDLVDLEGYDADLYNGTGGNNIAMNLVTQGCKYQGCNPGMVSGRDGILAANDALYDGCYTDVIWAAFARRGLGEGASQGNTNDRSDQTEAFDTPTPGSGGGGSGSAGTATLTKTADKSMASCGEEITFTLEGTGAASLCGPAPSNVDIADILPAGLTYVAGSASNGGTESGGTITWPQIASLDGNVMYTYRATVDCANITSTPTEPVNDDIEAGVNPLASATNTTGLTDWTITSTQANSGSSSWYAAELEADPETSENQYLTFGPLVLTGTSSLSFSHIYDTEDEWDGGKVEISTDGGTTWTDIDNSIYGGSWIADDTNIGGFSGLLTTWTTVNVDLSAYAGTGGCDGSDIYIRFNFYYDFTAVGTAGNGVNDGWYIDDVQITTEAAAVVVNQATITQNGNTQTVSECVSVDIKQVCVAPKVFIQGPLSGASMATSLNTNTLIPSMSPYADAESYTGSFPANAVDWVYVEIRSDNSATPATSYGKSAVLLADGTVVNADGSSVCFPGDPGMWYVVIKHRNHLGVMTANAVMLN